MELQAHPKAHERSELPVSAHGRLKVTDWVIGTVPDRETAETCAEALVSAGLAEDDVLVESPSMALQQLQVEEASTQRDSPLVRLLFTLEETVTGAGAALRAVYVKEAQSDRWFVGGHDVEGNQTDRMRNLLVDHGGRSIYLVEPSGVRHLG